MDLSRIYYCRECRASHHRSIKNLKNAVLESPRNVPANIDSRTRGVLEDYAHKNIVKKPEDVVRLTRMAIERKKEWQSGRVLTVSFMGGNKTVKERLIKHAQRWSDYANIMFDFKHQQKIADIRISFNTKDGSLIGDRRWSFLLSIDAALPKELYIDRQFSVDQTRDESRTESVVDINDRHVRRT